MSVRLGYYRAISMLMAMGRGCRNGCQEIERGNVKYVRCNAAKVEGPISIRRMSKYCMTCVLPGEGVCGPLELPPSQSLSSITLVFSHQTFDPLVQGFGDGPTDSMGYKLR